MNRDEFHALLLEAHGGYAQKQLLAHDAEQRDRITALTDWLMAIAGARQEADEWEHPDFDWRLLAHKQEALARRALLESTTTEATP